MDNRYIHGLTGIKLATTDTIAAMKQIKANPMNDANKKGFLPYLLDQVPANNPIIAGNTLSHTIFVVRIVAAYGSTTFSTSFDFSVHSLSFKWKSYLQT